MNPHASPSISLISLFFCIKKNWLLIEQLTKREITVRYKGSFFGITWAFLNPILMLVVYTFLFSVVFKAKWNLVGEENTTQFAVILFVGLIVYSIFSDVVNRASSLMISNVNFVKKIVFPLEILPVITMFSVLINSGINLIILLLFFTYLNGFIYWTVIFIPLVLMPLIFFTLGLAWIIASLGVFLRDITHMISTFTMVISFLAPVFYPITAVPEKFRPWLMANPLTFVLEQSRAVIIWGHLPDWWGITCYTFISIFIAWAGFIWFQKTRKGFSDVL